MKKFLRIKLPGSDRDIPAELDAAILATAAMRAQTFRRKKVIFKVAFPGAIIGSAAAAAAVIALMPTAPVAPSAVSPQPMIQTLGQNKVTPGAIQTKLPVSIPTVDMLSLADTSSLEQECYNLSTMPDFTWENDSFTI